MSRKTVSQSMSEVMGKIPPNAKDLESSILGLALNEKGKFDEIQDLLKPEHFYSEPNQIVFSAMMALANKSFPIDILTVKDQLERTSQLEAVGGVHYLVSLSSSVTKSTGLEKHCKIVLEKFILRQIIQRSGEAIANAYEPGADAFELLDKSEENISSIGTAHIHGDMVDIDTAMVQTLEKIAEWKEMDSIVTGVPSGFKEIDELTRGWQPTDLIVIGARPGAGKSAFALNLARNAILDPIKPTKVAFFSLEMSTVQLMLRMFAAESEILLSRLQSGRMEKEHMDKLYKEAVNRLSGKGLFFNDMSSMSLSALRAKARAAVRKKDVGLIIIDYLQLMEGTGEKNREQEISKISRGLKKTARELGVPIIALSQLGRAAENKGTKTHEPKLSDLRESGAIEQDADIVLLLWEPDDEEIASRVNSEPDVMSERSLKLAKFRGGMKKKWKLHFKGIFQKFNIKPEKEGFQKPEKAVKPKSSDQGWFPIDEP